jgi:hypothetical protein
MSDTKRLSIDGCITPPLKKIFDRIAENAKIQETIENNVTILIGTTPGTSGPTYLNGQPASYYLDLSNHTSFLTNGSMPRRMIELTGNLSGGSANAKFYDWDGVSAYGTPGSNFTVYDVFSRWPHSVSGDRGWITQDRIRNVWIVEWMNTPLVQVGYLDQGDSIASGSGSSGTVRVGGTKASPAKTYEVYGHNVLDTKSIPVGDDTRVTFYYDFDEAKRIAISTNKCVV